MSEDKKSRWYVAGVIALYWFISISLVYINKFIVSAQPVPIFITWSQVRLCTVVYQVCGCQALDSTVAWILCRVGHHKSIPVSTAEPQEV